MRKPWDTTNTAADANTTAADADAGPTTTASASDSDYPSAGRTARSTGADTGIDL